LPCLALLFALLSCLALCSVLLLLKWLTCCCYFYSYVACSNACSCWCGCWCCCSCGLLLHWHLTFDIDYSIQQRHQRTTTAAASHSGGHVSNICRSFHLYSPPAPSSTGSCKAGWRISLWSRVVRLVENIS
jgi:hypothetical protein